MSKTLPLDLKADINRFIELMIVKGDLNALPSINKLRKALDVGSPVLDAHVNTVAKNALTPGVATFDLTEEERFLIGDLMNRMELWREGKPGPPKEFPIQINLRVSTVERDSLDRIREKTGEAHSEIIRRLVREADPAA